MESFDMIPRQGVIVYLYRIRNSNQLRNFGQIKYVSKKMKYVLIYMNQEDVEDNVNKLRKLKFVKFVEKSERPFLKVDYADDDGHHFEMTEEDRERLKTVKGDSK